MKSRTQLGKSNLGRDVNRLVVAINHAPTLVTGADHGTLTGLDGDDHSQYFHLSQDEVIVGQPTFSPATPQAPFVLSANGQGQTVIGLKADELNKSVTAGTGLTGGGALTSTVTINHDTGDLGDLHTNYAEYDQVETITGAWTFTDLLTVKRVTSPQLKVAYNDTMFFTVSVSSAGRTSMTTTTQDDIQILGKVGIGSSAKASLGGELEITGSTFQQFRMNDGAGTMAMSIGTNGKLIVFSSGDTELRPTGDLILNPGGDDIAPLNSWTVDLGRVAQQWREIHAAELWVGTLVAWTQLATVGGSILVAPSTELTAQLSQPDTSIHLKHQLTNGSFCVLKADNKTEWLVITDAGTPETDGYVHTCTRALDGAAHQFYAGDAVVSTGGDGGGYMDIYSQQAISSGTGPTIQGIVRDGAAYNDLVTAWAVGNLEGTYGYGSEVYGAGFGLYQTGNNYMTIDPTDGIQFWDDASFNMGSVSGKEWILGRVGATLENIRITNSAIYFRVDTAIFGELSSSAWTIGQTASDHIIIDPTNGLQIKDSTTVKLQAQTDGDLFIGSNIAAAATTYFSIFATAQTYNTESVAAGDMLIGDNSASKANMFWDKSAGELLFRAGQAANIRIDTSGNFVIDHSGAAPSGVFKFKDGSTELARIAFYHNPAINIEYMNFIIDSGLSASRLFYFSGGDGLYVQGGSITAQTHLVAGQGLYVGNTGGLAENDNIIVDGDVKINEGLVVGNLSLDPVADELTVVDRIWVGLGSQQTNNKLTTGVQVYVAGSNYAFTSTMAGLDHGATIIAPTNQWFGIDIWAANLGGAVMRGFADGSQTRGVMLYGATQTQATTVSTSTHGVVVLDGVDILGTSHTSVGSTAAILTVETNSNTRMILRGNGDLRLDGVVGAAYDDYDDVKLLTGLKASITPQGDPWRERFGEWMEYSREPLEAGGIVTYNDDGHHFVSVLGLAWLTVDAIRQLYDRMNRYEAALLSAGVDPKLLTS